MNQGDIGDAVDSSDANQRVDAHVRRSIAAVEAKVDKVISRTNKIEADLRELR